MGAGMKCLFRVTHAPARTDTKREGARARARARERERERERELTKRIPRVNMALHDLTLDIYT